MNIFLGILLLAAAAFLVFLLIKNKALENQAAAANEESERLRQQNELINQETERRRQKYEADSLRAVAEAQAGLAEAQKGIEEQYDEMKEEAERISQHYESEARKIHDEAASLIDKTIKDFEPLRKYEGLRDTETEAKRVLTEALQEADRLRTEAQTLLETARNASAEERAEASRKANEIREQANSLLNQATREAGRIVAESNKRAEEIAGEAYTALRDHQLLEQGVAAMRNVIEGYGDRYLIPTRSLLDELAADFGHTEAGEALRMAREQSRRMVEQREAATCAYSEASRRETAVRFVTDAFNGRVDAILSRVKHDNYGTLAQEIRDAFSLVNLNGKAFREAQILPSFLDARLAELKWAVLAQELRLREREEQQRIKEQMREEEKARRDYERAMRDAAKEQEFLRQAMEKAQVQIQQATAEQKAKYEQQLQELSGKLKEAEERNQRAISMAQQTRRGNVYIISNIGSFGENVYKIGLTRRLDPLDRIRELGDSSVPFEFDVHAMILSEDAPALEAKLHRHFVTLQLNKINRRKEFFRVDLQHIREEIEKLGVVVKWTMTAEAAEYRESLVIAKAISADPLKRQMWIQRQFELERSDIEADEVVEAAAN